MRGRTGSRLPRSRTGQERFFAAVMAAGEWVGHDGGLALDRLAGADLEVRQDQFVLHGSVISLGPAAQTVTTAGRPDAVGV